VLVGLGTDRRKTVDPAPKTRCTQVSNPAKLWARGIPHCQEVLTVGTKQSIDEATVLDINVSGSTTC
jgi:hypothetical protein